MSRIQGFGIGLAVAAGLFGSLGHGGENEAPLAWRGQTSDALRVVAVRADSPQIAALYYNRAYQLDLERDYSYLEGLEFRGDGGGTNDLTAHRLLVVLTELIAEQAIDDPEQRIETLNRFYNTALDAAELRFKGYDSVADSLVFQ